MCDRWWLNKFTYLPPMILPREPKGRPYSQACWLHGLLCLNWRLNRSESQPEMQSRYLVKTPPPHETVQEVSSHSPYLVLWTGAVITGTATGAATAAATGAPTEAESLTTGAASTTATGAAGMLCWVARPSGWTHAESAQQPRSDCVSDGKKENLL